MNPIYFVIGGGALQVDFINKVKERGFIAHVFDYDPNCPGKDVADVFHCISIDDLDAILQLAKELHPVAIQTVATELGNITACYVGEKLGLKNNTYDVALNTTDKSRMKKVFKEFDIPNARFWELRQLNDIDNVENPFPLVIKASDRSAGRGVSYVMDQSQYEEAFTDALNQSNNKIVLAEEFMDGQQYSVETISSNGKHFIISACEANTDGIPFFVETHTLMPARLSDDKLHSLHDLVYKILNAFNIQYGPCHIELKFSKNQWKVIELASRMGGWRDKLASLSLGVDYLSLIIDASLGLDISFAPLKNAYAVCRFLLNDRDLQYYQKFLKHNPNNIVPCSKKLPDHIEQATTLMQSQGYYYLFTDHIDDLQNFMIR